MHFADSERSTIGLEWELQVLDAESMELVPRAPHLLDAANCQLAHGEMHMSMVELTSRKRTTVAQCADDIREAFDQLAPHADKEGLTLAGGGAHTFSSPSNQLVSPTERYDELVERTQYWGRQMVIYGTHVHVGVEKKEKVAPLLNFLSSKIGLLQALASSSPYWDSIDTGYADNRAMMFQQLPTAGLPHLIRDWEELEEITNDLKRIKAIREFSEVRWDVRPSPKFGTIEVRAFDAGTNLTEVRALAALVHCLVETASRELDAGRPLPVLPRHFIEINKWRAARFGTEASLVEDPSGVCLPLSQSIPSLIEWLRPSAEFLGCFDDLIVLPDMLGEKAAASRMRAVASGEGGTLERVMAHLSQELQAERPLAAGAVASRDHWYHYPIPGNQ